MIKFSVSRLEKEPIELVGEEPPQWLEIEPTDLLKVSESVHYDLLAKAVSGGALVEGKVSTVLSGVCGRCLEPITQKIENSGLHLFFELPKADELDISEDIRGEILLEIPMNLLCSENCRGLCPRCGKNQNMDKCACCDNEEPDDRWGALDNLKL
ncbi:MAG: DUF177 domain-containing protein [Victivallales bacterium]|jgi:uncharacterized protein|nr:DUF177 domain-containing protein [Victivallales bacterium]